MSPTLFRADALDAKRVRLSGAVILRQPARFGAFVLGILIAVAAITAFLVFGQYAKRQIASGHASASANASCWRALYRQPRLLFLDEATSHLDVRLESMINQAVRSLHITRIIIAHRPETIRSADRVFTLEGGRLQELPKGSDYRGLTDVEAVSA